MRTLLRGVLPMVLLLVVSVAACAASAPDIAPGGTSGTASPDDSGYAGFFPDTDGQAPVFSNDGAAPAIVGDAGASSTGSTIVFDASFDAVPCDGPPAAGDLVMVEMMVASQAGTGDRGEWVEVLSTKECALNLRGVHGDSPRGLKSDTFDIAQDLYLGPYATFLVADSSDPASNHALPGSLIAWAGQPADVLRNSGDTVTLSWGTTVLDTLTYSSFRLTVGTSRTFAASCATSVRADESKWQDSTASWATGYVGTPNASNVDVACPP